MLERTVVITVAFIAWAVILILILIFLQACIQIGFFYHVLYRGEPLSKTTKKRRKRNQTIMKVILGQSIYSIS
jgi:hypothetical protein